FFMYYDFVDVQFYFFFFFFFQAEDGIRDKLVTGVQTCALPISSQSAGSDRRSGFDRAAAARSRDRGTRRARHAYRPRVENHVGRSEERRVGKECRSRWAAYHDKKKEENMRIGIQITMK